jgi:hypothetical protein
VKAFKGKRASKFYLEFLAVYDLKTRSTALVLGFCKQTGEKRDERIQPLQGR